MTLDSDGPLSSGPKSHFTAHFPSSDRRASPRSTWRVSYKNTHYALGQGGVSMRKEVLHGSRHVGKAWETTVGGQELGGRGLQPGFQHCCRGAVAHASPLPITPGSSLEGPPMQTLGRRAGLLPPPKTIRYIPKPSRNDV